MVGSKYGPLSLDVALVPKVLEVTLLLIILESQNWIRESKQTFISFILPIRFILAGYQKQAPSEIGLSEQLPTLPKETSQIIPQLQYTTVASETGFPFVLQLELLPGSRLGFSAQPNQIW